MNTHRSTTSAAEFVAKLRAHVGDGVGLSTNPTDLARHLHDHSGLSHHVAAPVAVVYPRNTQEVSAILRCCHAEGVPLVPQGGLTGMVGGAAPIEQGLILSLERMRAIEAVDPSASTMTVQAGVPLQLVQARAKEHDLTFPMDLGARGSCTIGGNIATNAGGNYVLRYGMMRDLVLGLEVVLADGTCITSLNKMLKNNAGYDLKHLFIGSEGTLGVITRAVLRLFPAPSSPAVALCAASTYDEVVEFLQLAKSSLGGALRAFEVMWNDFYAVACSRTGNPPLSSDHNFYVLIEAVSGAPSATEALQRLIEISYERGLLQDAVLAKSLAECAAFWAIRDSSGELATLFGRAVNFDVSIPTGEIAQFAAACREQLDRALPGARTLVFGHIADSNIHLSCRGPGDSLPVELIESVVYDCVRKWNGSISAEHGIGLAKRDYLSYSRAPEEIALMRTLKRALDPKNILNPGKVIPPR